MAKNVSYTKVSDVPEFEADIAGAYPTDAQVKSWVRKLTFDRTGNSVKLSETYKLDKFVKPFELNFITILDIDLTDGSTLSIKLASGTGSISLVNSDDKSEYEG